MHRWLTHYEVLIPSSLSPDTVPVDLAIANAGVSEETTGTLGDVVGATRAIFPTNVARKASL